MLKAEIKELENLRHKLDERESIIKVISPAVSFKSTTGMMTSLFLFLSRK